jgi:two-component system OmpR family sensor kinase
MDARPSANSAGDDRQLLSLIGHELRSPAAVVCGYLRLLLKEDAAGLPERTRHIIEEADRSCARVLHLVKELAELAELLDSDLRRSPSTVPLFSACGAVAQSAAADGDGPVAFSCADQDRAALVRGDERRLRQALAALVAAIRRERGARVLEIYGFVSEYPDGSHAVVAFGDPGIALHRHDLPASGDASFDRWRGGTGLSVPIACRIVEAHGGRIWLPPVPGAAAALSLPMDMRQDGS